MKNLPDRNYIIGAHFFKFTHGSGRSCDGFWKEIVKEISIFARFNAKDGWEIWLITGVSSLTFTAFIKSKNKKLEKSLARRRKNSSFSEEIIFVINESYQ